MKYVAFLDILGFKDKLKSLSQEDAKTCIEGFSTTIYHIFETTDKKCVNGYIVSDSIILYTNNIEARSLDVLIQLVNSICTKEFSEHGILIRGAIAKGEFDNIPASGLPQLQKQLIVGKAYIEAYLLEGSVKTIGISLSREVYEDIKDNGSVLDIFEEKINDEQHYLFRYITIDFLLESSNLKQFVALAREAKWLPHYYNAIYFALKREANDKKVEQVFRNIEYLVCDNAPGERWRDLDLFIENSFNKDVIGDFKTRFLKHIRKNLFNKA